MATASIAAPASTAPRGLDHRTVWRWHFYAGLFCIPFVLWLAATGTIFLFKPQIERFLDRPYDHLTIAQRATVNAQAQAAVTAVPGSTLDAYQLPRTETSAAQILVDKGTQQFRVYVHPQTLTVLKLDNEDHRLENVVKRLHGELMIGKYGSWIVELAASWAVIMVVTGLFLWWPTNSKGLGGILYPRLRQGGRTFWKDIHSVVGIYVSFFALFLLFTGLPWAKAWGGYLKAIRHYSAGHLVQQDWTTSSADDLAARVARTGAPAPTSNDVSGMSTMHDMPGMPGMSGAHHMEGMAGMSSSATSEHAQHQGGRHRSTALSGTNAYVAIDTMVATLAPLQLAYPVLVSPPADPGGNWTAKSDSQNRPLTVNVELNPTTGAIVKRTDFSSKPWLDRVIGTGIAAHEGALFGLANQLLGLFTTAGLVTLSLSGLVMWWKRRPEGVLGAPAPIRRVRFSAGLVAILVVLGLYFPFLGGSMILVALAERFILRKIPTTRRWLGLYPAQTAAAS
jgi:uncharacterized iron-regulated membrane protein